MTIQEKVRHPPVANLLAFDLLPDFVVGIPVNFETFLFAEDTPVMLLQFIIFLLRFPIFASYRTN